MASEEQELVEFYHRTRMSKDKMQELHLAGQIAANGRKWRQFALASSLAFVCVTIIAGWLFVRSLQLQSELARYSQPVNALPAEENQRSTSDPASETKPLTTGPPFRFVAFRSHDDRCPHCRATGKMFAAIEKQINDEGIEFEQFELQQKEHLPKTLARIDSQKLTSMLGDGDETAFAALLTPEGREIRRFDPTDQPIASVQQMVLDIIDQ